MQATRSFHAPLRPVFVAVLALLNGTAHALPQDGKPSFGQTRITRPDGNTLAIQQSTARAGIDWARFSIGAGETVRITQPGASSVLVNRVTGLDPSVILGRMQANGRVFLTNPRGVIFGAGSQVDVGSLVATTLSLSDADARAGRWRLQPTDGMGAVVNEGSLRAGNGTIALVGPQVANRGHVEAARVAMGAVSEVQIDLDGDGLILLNARAADAARLDQLGSVAAGSRAELIAAARGQVAGTVLNMRGAVVARGLRAQGGEIVIDGGPAGIVEVGAAVDASSATGHGGDVLVLGQKLLLDNAAHLDASGATGGGRVRVGGEFQGANPEVHNSEMLSVAPGAVVDASATQRGDGGQVVLWSDRSTRFYGQVAARGGAQGGHGGSAEVSGKQTLVFGGAADLRAPHGAVGSLLLDPTDITIDDAFVDTILPGSVSFGDAPSNPIFAGVDVSALLSSASLVLQATRDLVVTNNGGPLVGTNPLTLRAGRDLTINASIATNGITLSANDNGAGTATGTGRVTVNAALNAGTGALVINNNSSAVANQLSANLSGATLDIQGTTSLSAPQTWSFSGTSFVAAQLTGSAPLTLTGAGSLMLTGSSTGYTGNIAVDAGGLIVAGFNTLGNGVISVAGGARLDVDGTLGNAVTLAAGATAGTSNSSGAQYTGTVTLAGDAAIDGRSGDVQLDAVAESGGARGPQHARGRDARRQRQPHRRHHCDQRHAVAGRGRLAGRLDRDRGRVPPHSTWAPRSVSNTISAGHGATIASSGGGALAAGTLTLADGATLNLSSTVGMLTVSRAITAAPGAGAESVQISGGQVAFGANNTYGGTTSIASGSTLRVGTGGAHRHAGQRKHHAAGHAWSSTATTPRRST